VWSTNYINPFIGRFCTTLVAAITCTMLTLEDRSLESPSHLH
jgi:hypothetical protein